MLQKRISSFPIPCWLYSNCLEEQICTNSNGAKTENLALSIQSVKSELKEKLKEEDILFFGEEEEYMASKQGENVFIQLIEGKQKNDNILIKADITEELNKVLKQEIEQHQETQEKLKENSAKLKAIFDSTALYIWTMGGDSKLTSFNAIFAKQIEEWFDRKIENGKKLIEDPYEENTAEWNRFQEELQECLGGEKKNIELNLKTKVGREVWVEIYMEPIVNSDKDKIEDVSCIGFEITDKRLIDQQISQSLKEKETLLQEVHHRVKNNLQIISSLLNLQTSFVHDESTLDVLKESQNRIKSMSFIHESLYMSKNFSSVDIKEYVKGLSSNLLQSYCLNPELVKINMNIDELTLNIDQAIPCGLIINELVSNTFKHAFPDGRSGELKINVKEKEGRMAMMIADNGCGIPNDWDPEKSDSLGIQLVYTLTEQLDGEIEFSGEKGTKYLITFDRIKNN